MTRLSVILAVCGLCGCLRSERVAGGTSETTNGGFAASVLLADGTPAAHAWVRVVDDGDWAAKVAEGRSVVLDSALTDSGGAFRVRLADGRRCNLQIDAEHEALFLRGIHPSPEASAPRLTLAAKASLSGSAHPDSGTIRALRLAGTAYAASLQGDGAYAFAGLAPGSFDIIAVLYRNGALAAVPVKAVDLEPGQARSGYDLGVASARVVANDFEQDFWYQTPLGGIAGGGWSATQNGAAVIHSAIVSGDGAYAGKSLATDIVFKASDPTAPPAAIPPTSARVGFSLDASINLSKMSAVSFYAMGNGRIYLRFHSRSLNALSGDSVQFQYPIDLRSAWTHVNVPVDSLALTTNAPAALQGYAWANAAKDILAVEFTALPALPAGADSAAQSFRLDDVTFEGLTSQDLKQ